MTEMCENGLQLPSVVSPFYTPGLLIQDEVCLQVQCRGIDLLGFAFGGSIFVCVHQFAVELWKRYDTPRVSVQKKIIEMGIQPMNCTKEQVKALRKAGIIENFRATILRIHEAEKLFDALEFSRKKRGLVKHALKSTAVNRGMRREELRAKRLSCNQRVLSDVHIQDAEIRPIGIHFVVPNYDEQGALNRAALESAAVVLDKGGSSPGAKEGANLSQCRDDGSQAVRESFVCSEEHNSTSLATLLVAEEAVVLSQDAAYKRDEFVTELVPNEWFVDTAPSSSSAEFAVPRRTDHSCYTRQTAEPMQEQLDVVQGYWYASQSQQPQPSATENTNHPLDPSRLCPPTIISRNCPVSRLHSPPYCSSGELEERSSHVSLSISSRSHSTATTPAKSSPERFLFIDSEDSCQELEVLPKKNCNQNNCSTVPPRHQYRGIPHKGKEIRGVCGGVGGGVSVFSSSLADLEEPRGSTSGSSSGSGADEVGIADNLSTTLLHLVPKHRNVKATKLCHYAKTTSPATQKTPHQQDKAKPDSLIVSISLSALRGGSPAGVCQTATLGKPRKPTALSNFVTKKRALSRSPSVQSDLETGASLVVLDGSRMGKRPKSAAGTKGGKCGKVPAKGKRLRGRPRLSMTIPHNDQSTDSQVSLSTPVETSQTELHGNLTAGGNEVQHETAPSLLRHELDPLPTVIEDDEMSIASSNMTTSSANSIVACNKRQLQRGGARRMSRSSLLRVESNFSLESLFSHCPPTLTVRDGELVPEQSLSIKNLDRFTLPSSHPIDRWSLGQPVRGRWTGGSKTKRQRKNHNHLAKI